MDGFNFITYSTDTNILSWYKTCLEGEIDLAIPSSLSVIINTKHFIDEMIKSYEDKNDIMKQFVLDFSRLQIYINNEKITDLESTIHIFTKIEGRENINGLLFSALLCCQSSFYFSLIFLHNNILDSEKVRTTDKNNIPKTIKLQITENKINKLILETEYKFINIELGKEVYTIKSGTEIDFESINSLLTYEIIKFQELK